MSGSSHKTCPGPGTTSLLGPRGSSARLHGRSPVCNAEEGEALADATGRWRAGWVIQAEAALVGLRLIERAARSASVLWRQHASGALLTGGRGSHIHACISEASPESQ